MEKQVPNWLLGLFKGCGLKDHPRDPHRRQDPAQGGGLGLLAGGCCRSPHVQVEAGRLYVFKLPARQQRDAVTRAASEGPAGSRQDTWGLQAGGSSLGGGPQTTPHSLGTWYESPEGRIFATLLVFTSLDLLHGSDQKPGKPQRASPRQSPSSWLV